MEADYDFFSSFLECLPYPAFAVDEVGTIIFANKAIKPRIPERVGGDLGTLKIRFPEYYLALGGPGGWLHTRDLEVVRKPADGSVVYERLWLRNLPSGAYLVIVTDETQLKMIEISNAQSARLASLGFMVASVCHEVSNPLTAVHSMVQILQSNADAPRELVDKGLANIACNIKRILELSKRLVGYCRVGDQPKRAFMLDDAILDAIDMARQDRMCHEVVFEHLPSPDAYIRGNAGEIREVLFNVLLNAVQAMDGRGRIVIATFPCAPGRVEIAIRDSGPGIAPQFLERLFDPFFTTKPVGQGTGLGLAISTEIIREHGGTIRVENGVKEGAIFFVELPLCETCR